MELAVQALVQLQTIRWRIEIQVFMLQTAPESFDEHVINSSAFAVHGKLAPTLSITVLENTSLVN